MLSIILPIVALLIFFILLHYRYDCSLRGKFDNLIVKNKENIDPSYTLLAPFCALEGLHEKGNVYLVNLHGERIHSWQTEYQPFAAYLKKDGNLVVSLISPENIEKYPSGKADIIHELDWSGNVVWEYKNGSMHHDFEILPDGNAAAVVYDKVPKDIAEKIEGGIPDSEFMGEVWSDAIIEIDKTSKKIAWIWHAHEHLDPGKYRLNGQTPRSEWTHSNSLRYVEKDPFGGEEAYLISMRHISAVILFRRKDGKIIWESPQNMLAYQHDATFLDNGNILVFDNGLFRKQERPSLWSRVIEIDPKKNEIVWQFDGGKTRAEKNRFSASVLGSTQRLRNGNTFIANGLHGHIFEVTPQGQIVWDFNNPFSAHTTGPWPNNIFFKARRYQHDDIAWPEKLRDKPI